MSAKFIPIMECVSEFLDQYDKSMGDADKAYVIAFRGLESMHFNISAEPKTLRLPVNANMTVNFPDDYIQWCKIGILNSTGELITLRINNSLTTFKDDYPQRLSLLTADVDSSIGTGSLTEAYLNYWNGIGYAPLYGIGKGIQNFGECRVDEKNNLIVLGTDFKYSEVIVEYISCPERDNDYKVDRRLREPLIAFIAWKFRLDTDTNYYARLTESRRMIQPFNMQRFNQVIREQNKFCLKM